MLPRCKDARTEERKRGGCDRWERNNGRKYYKPPYKPLQSHLNPGNTDLFFIKVRGKNNDENSPAGPAACRALN